MKKILSLMLSFILVLSLCSCSGSSYALTVDGTQVSDEIYGYWLSVAVNSAEYIDNDDKDSVAGALCAEYVASEKLIDKFGIQLSAEEKVAVSSEIKVNWQLYSSFYEKYSVSKQTLCEIMEHESLINSLVLSLYSSDGERALSEKEISEFFNQNYAVIKIISTDFNAEMTEDTINDITQKYTAMRNIINGGGEISSAAGQYPDLAEYEDVEHVISSFDTSYPDGMFEKILNIKNGSTQVLRYGSGIYLVQKCDATDYLDIYKEDCIVKLKKAEVLEEIRTEAKNYTVDYNKRVVSKFKSKADL